MNDVQRDVIAKADAKIARAMEPYHLRMGLYRKVNGLPDDRLKRLAQVVEKLTPDELDAALGYAEGLAAWRWVDEESSNASLSEEGTQTSADAGGP